jgi:hypothetical protein
MVTFSYGNVSVSIDDPDFPLNAGYSTKQSIIETEAGNRYVYTFAKPRKKWQLRWDFLDIAQYNDLENFIVNIVNFAEKPFTYTDHEGNSLNVRCTSFSSQQLNSGYYSVSLTIEEEL